MGPPGCKIIVYENPGKRGLWESHEVPEFYIKTFMGVY